MHDSSLDRFYERVGRGAFCASLQRFWERFAHKWWELLLRGNPIVDIFNGLKLSAGGELGVGVGEEEWGSGERAVLEDFVGRTDGLVDLVVSKFSGGHKWWLGSGAYPQVSDGVIFSGVGGIISRRSLITISQWMEWIFRFGDRAPGVGDETRKRKKKKKKRPWNNNKFSPGIPLPLVTAAEEEETDRKEDQYAGENKAMTMKGLKDGTGTVFKYLTLGYGSSWSLWRDHSQGRDQSRQNHNPGQDHNPEQDHIPSDDCNGSGQDGNPSENHDPPEQQDHNHNQSGQQDQDQGQEQDSRPSPPPPTAQDSPKNDDDDGDEGSFVIGLEDSDEPQESTMTVDDEGRRSTIKIRMVHVYDATGKQVMSMAMTIFVWNKKPSFGPTLTFFCSCQKQTLKPSEWSFTR